MDVRETSIGCPLHMCLNQGSNPQPRYVPRLGIELAIFFCTGRSSNQLGHLARANFQFLKEISSILDITYLRAGITPFNSL